MLNSFRPVILDLVPLSHQISRNRSLFSASQQTVSFKTGKSWKKKHLSLIETEVNSHIIRVMNQKLVTKINTTITHTQQHKVSSKKLVMRNTNCSLFEAHHKSFVDFFRIGTPLPVQPLLSHCLATVASTGPRHLDEIFPKYPGECRMLASDITYNG